MTYDDSDTEAVHERTPIIGRHTNGGTILKKSAGFFSKVAVFFGGGIYAPDKSTYEPIEILLNAENEDERDKLTERWRDNRLSELNFVGVVAALLAGVLTSTGSWPDILPEDEQKPWPVRTAWYCGIILSLFSILTAADQTVRLHRLSSHKNGMKKVRKLLAKRTWASISASTSVSVRIKPNKVQIYTWQLPVIFLTSATISMIVGMFLHVWSATRFLDLSHWWDSEAKMAVTFTIVALASIIIFFLGQVTLYTTDEDWEEEE